MTSSPQATAPTGAEINSSPPEHLHHLPPAMPDVVMPSIVMPHDGVGAGVGRTISDAAEELFREAAKTNRFFRRGQLPVQVFGRGPDTQFVNLDKTNARSAFESIGRIVIPRRNRQGQLTFPQGNLSSDTTAALLGCHDAVSQLPEIVGTFPVPILANTKSGPVLCGSGYSAETKMWISADIEVPEIPVNQAVGYLLELLSEFQFLTPSDRSRAFASFLTPMLHVGGWLPDSAVPVDLAQADDSQSGKTYRQKIVAAIYGAKPAYVDLKNRGVGGVEESVQAFIFAGKAFIAIDNLKEKLNSGSLEQIITNTTGEYQIRLPYQRPVVVSAKFLILISSNRPELSADLANRSSIVRITKRQGFQFSLDPEQMVKSQPGLYLGCVVSVLKEWARRGCPRSSGVDHDFRAWAGACDYIVREIAGLAPLLDGHRDAQTGTANPLHCFLREIGLRLRETGQLGKQFSASGLREQAGMHGIALPGFEFKLDDEEGKKSEARRLGSMLAPLFRSDASIGVDRFNIMQVVDTRERDGHGTEQVKFYMFTEANK